MRNGRAAGREARPDLRLGSYSAFRIPLRQAQGPEQRRGTHSAFRGARGFTFLELLIVVAIAGMVASLAAPSLMASLRQWRLQAVVREVRTLFTYARNQAVARREALQVILDRARNVYWLDAADPVVLEDPTRSEDPRIRRYVLPAGFRFGEVTIGGTRAEGDRVGILFFPRGSSIGGEVQILSDRQRSYRVRVQPLTGQARIEGS